MSAPRLRDVVACLDQLYDPAWAQAWDAVGLVCGDPDAHVGRVLFAVDPVQAVADEAIGWQADLLVAHHPLLLEPVHGVAANTPKGRVVHQLIRAGVALHVCHTNADTALPGVSDALGSKLGLRDQRPLAPEPQDPLDKVVTFVPSAEADRIVDALAAAGAGSLGDYDRCAFSSAGTGTFRPGPGADPAIGTVGEITTVEETRVEMVLPRHRRTAVVSALLKTHPYEEPAYDVLEMAAQPGDHGIGRIGTLPEVARLDAFAARVAAALPAVAGGVRVAGDPAQPVRTVAVCGGAGDFLLDRVRSAGVDAYVTSDLRHHPASEFREHASSGEQAAEHRTALVDVSHWAAEALWLTVAAERLRKSLAETGSTVVTRTSETRTDPWTFHLPSAPPD